MAFRNAYSGTLTSGSMRSILIRYLFLLLVLTGFPGRMILFSQDLPEFDEIAVFLEIPGLGGSEIDALIKANELYLPVSDLFNFLKIKNDPSPGLETITGFLLIRRHHTRLTGQKTR